MQQRTEQIIWIAIIIIMAIGLTALYSASYNNPRVPHRVFYDQLIGVCIGLVVMFALSHVDYNKLYDATYFLYAFTIFALFFVLITGRYVLGARRWIEVGGLNIQPSELAKLSVILILARYFSQRRSLSYGSLPGSFALVWEELILPFLVVLLPVLLVFKQPDLGTSLLLVGIFVVMIFAGGVRYRYVFGFLGVSLACAPLAWHVMKQYQRDRLLVFLNPNIDPLGAGYTITQSKIAIGSGQIFGKGWLSGTQSQLNFLPERHTDFIFSVIGEEWGFIGALLLTVCFFVLVNSCLSIAQNTKERFGFLLVTGVAGIVTLQIVINIGMVLGLCPVVGLTLPFVSYGRSSFIVFVVMMGFVLNVNRRRMIF